MKAGRELDAMIAEKVMRLEEIRMEESWPSIQSLVYGNHPHRNCGMPVPEYSTDISAAWEVVEKLRGQSHLCDFELWTCCDDECRAEFTMHKTFFAYGESPSHAICLAALKAMGVEG